MDTSKNTGIGDNSPNPQPQKKKEPKKVSAKIGDKDFTRDQFISLIALDKKAAFWVRKKYTKKDRKTGFLWSKEFIEHGVFHEVPTVLNRVVQES